MAIDWTARRERARAFLAQQRKPGRAWHTLTYAFDWEDDMYLMRQDLDPKKSDERKVAEGIATYVGKFGVAPTEVTQKAPGLWWLGPIAQAQ